MLLNIIDKLIRLNENDEIDNIIKLCINAVVNALLLLGLFYIHKTTNTTEIIYVIYVVIVLIVIDIVVNIILHNMSKSEKEENSKMVENEESKIKNMKDNDENKNDDLLTVDELIENVRPIENDLLEECSPDVGLNDYDNMFEEENEVRNPNDDDYEDMTDVVFDLDDEQETISSRVMLNKQQVLKRIDNELLMVDDEIEELENIFQETSTTSQSQTQKTVSNTKMNNELNEYDDLEDFGDDYSNDEGNGENKNADETNEKNENEDLKIVEELYDDN